mgnify:CR=1 FL=1
MKSERWQEIEQLYHAVLQRDASERAAFLAEACKDDEVLRRAIADAKTIAPRTDGRIRRLDQPADEKPCKADETLRR